MQQRMEKWFQHYFEKAGATMLSDLEKKNLLLACRLGAVEDIIVKLYPALKVELERLFLENFEIAKKIRKEQMAKVDNDGQGE